MIKSVCRTCEPGGKPGKILKEGGDIDCPFCENGWVVYPISRIVPARKDSPPDTVACLEVERAENAFIIVDLDSFRALHHAKELLRYVKLKPPVNDT